MKIDTSLLLKNKNYFYIFLIYLVIIIIFFIGNNSLKKTESIWNKNTKIIDKEFLNKKRNCNNFLIYFNKKKIENKKNNFYILNDFHLNLKKKNQSEDKYLQNLHSYLIQTLKFNYYKSKKNIIFMSCISKNEILVVRYWQNKIPIEKYMLSWKK